VTAELLVREFERMAEAPDAVTKLRRHVFELAVRGRLAAQYAADEPSTALLRRCQAARQQTASRLPIQLPPVEDPPFHLPNGWAWTRLGITGRIFNGTSVGESEKAKLSKVVDGLPFIATKDVGYGRTDLAYDNGLKVPFDEPGFKIAHTGAVLICSEGGSAGKKIGFADRPICFGNKLYANEPWPGIDSRYVLALYQAPSFYAALTERMTGIIGGISLSEFLLLAVPIPPELEQHRIVAKVDEMMAVCDELEAAQKEREVTRDTLRAASLHRLTVSYGDGAASVTDVRFFLARSPRLITKPEHMTGVRQATLELAVRGRLVRQDSTDEPAAEVLMRIPVPARKRRSAPSRHAGEHGATPFELPMGWEWTYFGRLISRSDAGWSPMTEVFARDGDAWAVLKVSAVSWDAFRSEENKQLLPGVAPRLDAQVHSGDFLISRANTSELVAKAVIVLDPPRNLMLSDKIVRLELVADCVPRYLLLINNHAEYARAYYAQKASGASPSMKNVSREVIYSLPIPLPPIAEQHRIVAKVDQLMAVCDELEAALASTQDGRRRLLEALLHEALEGAAVSLSEEAGRLT
jgi:type I restriction enzyme, S subunit